MSNETDFDQQPEEGKEDDFTGEIAEKFLTDFDSILESSYDSSVKQLCYDFYKSGYQAKAGEAVEFAEWISNNQFTCYNNIWTSTKIHYMPTEYSTEQLFDLFKTKNK